MEPIEPDAPSFPARDLTLGVTAPTGLTALPARELARLVRDGGVSAEEIVAAHLRRIAEVDPVLHAMVVVDAEGALARAAQLDADRRLGRPIGPLTGVPLVVKDNIDVRRQTTACGSAAHAGSVALRDAPTVTRLLEAGAVVLGRTNMDELAMGASTQTSAFGATRNPWHLQRSPGGSSGGSAAAVAAGLAALSIGTDTGGSIREPASQCGIVGVAPSPGVVPLAGAVPFATDLDRVGPLTRTVADAAAMLAVLADRPDLAASAARRGRARELRVGLVTELSRERNHDGVLERLGVVADALDELGVSVVEASIPDGLAALDAYMTITSAACVEPIEPYVRTGQAGPEVVRRWEYGRRLRTDGSLELERAHEVRDRLAAQSAAALAGCDVLLSPTMPTTAPLLYAETSHRGDALATELADPLAAPYTDCWTVIANLAGLPSLSVPAGSSSDDGMPVGVMLSSAPGADGDLLALAGLLADHGIADR